ncbi:MAG: 3-deoxy-D-manno-octulosonate 8-phosphate phosphatase [Calditrichaeota bacterium]|nr:MAG: 3-deoxy-D-manno-octulosonate 8-phosphate phosphatase [Calditrichota bacterium]
MQRKIKPIRLLLMDVDGVLTAGGIIYSANGDELKSFNIQDGMGVTLMRMAGLKTGIITGRRSPMVERRARELKMDLLDMGHFDKLPRYYALRDQLGLRDEEIAYIGDDVQDLCILKRVGFSVAPANARPQVKERVDYVTEARGGEGAVRETVDLILYHQGRWEELIRKLEQ